MLSRRNCDLENRRGETQERKATSREPPAVGTKAQQRRRWPLPTRRCEYAEVGALRPLFAYAATAGRQSELQARTLDSPPQENSAESLRCSQSRRGYARSPRSARGSRTAPRRPGTWESRSPSPVDRERSRRPPGREWRPAKPPRNPRLVPVALAPRRQMPLAVNRALRCHRLRTHPAKPLRYMPLLVRQLPAHTRLIAPWPHSRHAVFPRRFAAGFSRHGVQPTPGEFALSRRKF